MRPLRLADLLRRDCRDGGQRAAAPQSGNAQGETVLQYLAGRPEPRTGAESPRDQAAWPVYGPAAPSDEQLLVALADRNAREEAV